MNTPSPTTRPQATAPVFGRPQTSAPLQAARPSIDFRASIRKGPQTSPPSIYLYGVEKVGKSTAGSQMPAPVFLCAENGLIGEQFAEVEHVTLRTWEDVLAFLDFLVKEQHDWKSLVTDTVDWLESVLYEYLCRIYNKPNIEAFGYSKGQNVLAPEEFKKFLSRCDLLKRKGLAILFLSHSKVKNFKNPIGEDYDRFEPKGNALIAGLVKEWCDVVLFAHEVVYFDTKGLKTKAFGGKVRVVETDRDAAWDAGNRYGLPTQMPLDMPLILETIAQGNGGGANVADLLAEIEQIIPQLSANGQARARTDLASAGEQAPALSRLLNALRATLARIQETQQPTFTEET